MPHRRKNSSKPRAFFFAETSVSLTRVAAIILAWSTAAYGQTPPSSVRHATETTTIVERMGSPMSEAAARHGIGFRPFAPPRRITAAALLPPFHGDDTRANRGIGMEYLSPDGRRYALAQWPSGGGSLEPLPFLETSDAGCAGARAFRRSARPDGIAWSTPNRIIMTLQADGANDARTLDLEWRKLVRRGACR